MSQISKIQIRAQVLQSVLKFKNLETPSDSQVEECIRVLNEIENKSLVAQLLLKEISANGSFYDNLLTLFLFSVCDNKTICDSVFLLLNDSNVSDVKKLFLINILREQGQNIDYNFIVSHISNPDEAIDIETKKFLQDAKTSPEVQIDFFDFFFTVADEDKTMLINSIVDDYSGDELANILAPFAYFYPDNYISDKILDALVKSHSYFALEPLKWCAQNCPDKNLAQKSHKLYAKLILSGLDAKKPLQDIFSNVLSDSSPLGFWYSCADGNSNISCVFARQRKNGFVQTFFTVFNLYNGPIACFGFNEISKKDFDVILLRFFKSSVHSKISLSEGKLIFDYLSSQGWKNNVKIPYEFICWRHLTYDVKSIDYSFDKLLCKHLKKIKTTKKVLNEVVNSDIFSSWFYDYSTLPLLSNLFGNILNKNIDSFEILEKNIENLIDVLMNDDDFINRFYTQLYFQSYILHKSNMQNTANALYSVSFDIELTKYFIFVLIKKSIYIYLVNYLNSLKNSPKNIFGKTHNVFDESFLSSLLSDIEEKWTSKEE